MKLPVWSEEDQKNVSASLTNYNLNQKISNTSSDDETADVNDDNT